MGGRAGGVRVAGAPVSMGCALLMPQRMLGPQGSLRPTGMPVLESRASFWSLTPLASACSRQLCAYVAATSACGRYLVRVRVSVGAKACEG